MSGRDPENPDIYNSDPSNTSTTTSSSSSSSSSILGAGAGTGKDTSSVTVQKNFEARKASTLDGAVSVMQTDAAFLDTFLGKMNNVFIKNRIKDIIYKLEGDIIVVEILLNPDPNPTNFESIYLEGQRGMGSGGPWTRHLNENFMRIRTITGRKRTNFFSNDGFNKYRKYLSKALQSILKPTVEVSFTLLEKIKRDIVTILYDYAKSKQQGGKSKSKSKSRKHRKYNKKQTKRKHKKQH